MKKTTFPVVLLTSARFLALALVAFLAFPVYAKTPSQSDSKVAVERIALQHQQILDELNAKNDKGRVMDLNDSRIPALVKKGWDLAGEWAATYIEAHPSPSKAELNRIFEGFAPEPHGIKSQYGDFLEYTDYSFTGSATRVGPSVYVVQARYTGIDFPTGTFMVVARNRDGHFRALWNIKDLAEQHYPQRDEIGRWLHLVSRAYYNGPLNVADIIPLTSAKSGHSRFLVKAYQGADGGTVLAQLGIWEWDGEKAQPLLVDKYYFAVDDGGSRFDGRTLRIRTKEELHTLFSCGSCPDPRGVWTVRITPSGVENQGHRFLQPEIQWADELLSKIEKGEPTADLADPKVAKALETAMAESQSGMESEPTEPVENRFLWGMLEHCRVIRRGAHGAFVLTLDDVEVRVSYALHHKKPYFTSVRIRRN